jgi:hypothetical protein
MESKILPAIVAITLMLLLACSGTASNQPVGDDRFFVPEGLPNTLEMGQVGVTLTLVASTLVEGATSAELYVAVRNDGNAPTCNAAIITNFIANDGQIVTTVGATLQGKQLYQLPSSTAVLNCIDPGEIVMGASLNLPAEVVIGELSALTHRFPTFGLVGIIPLGSFTVSQVQVVAKGAASAYQGVFTNALNLNATAPSVTIYPVNRVGRPLGAVSSSTTIALPPGGSWSFETTTMNDLGVEYAAYPSAAVSAD